MNKGELLVTVLMLYVSIANSSKRLEFMLRHGQLITSSDSAVCGNVDKATHRLRH